MMKTVTKAMIAALTLSMGAPGLAAPHRVTVVNSTAHTMLRLFASPSTGRAVDEDVLGDTVLKPGQSAQLAISGGGDACTYDLKGSFDDGTTKVRAKVDVCAVQTYRFTAG